jgi:hypothetical protein
LVKLTSATTRERADRRNDKGVKRIANVWR